jgi:hypothetical protein
MVILRASQNRNQYCDAHMVMHAGVATAAHEGSHPVVIANVATRKEVT